MGRTHGRSQGTTLCTKKTSKGKGKGSRREQAEEAEVVKAVPRWYLSEAQLVAAIQDRRNSQTNSSRKTFNEEGAEEEDIEERAEPPFSFASSLDVVQRELSPWRSAAVEIQRHVRGWLERKRFWKRVHGNTINAQQFAKQTEALKKLHFGWCRLFCHSIFVLVVILFVLLTSTDGDPSGRSLEFVLLELFENMETKVDSQTDIIPRMRELATKLFRADPNAISKNETCRAAMIDCSGPVPFECFEMNTNSGYLDPYNRIIFGLLVNQERYETTECDTDNFSVYPIDKRSGRCYSKNMATSYAKPLNNSMMAQYNVLDQAYTYRTGDEAAMPGFYTFLNLGVFNLPLEATLCDIGILESLRWVDEATAKICFLLGVENRNGQGIVGTFTECFHFDYAGRVTATQSVESAQPRTVSEFQTGIILLCLYILVFVGHFMAFVRKWRKRAFQVSIGICLEFLTLLAHFFSIALYISLITTSSNLVQATIQLDETALDDLGKVWQSLSEIRSYLDVHLVFEAMLAIVLLSMAFRTILYLDFHPRLGFISKTVSIALSDLGLFVLVYITLVAFYGIIGNLVLGTDSDLFRSVGMAMNSLLFSSLGEIGFIMDTMQEEKPRAWQTILFWFYFWSYIVLTTILLLNVLLSIIVDSFIKIQEDESRSTISRFTTSESILMSLQWFYFDVKHYHLPRLKAFFAKCCCRKAVHKSKPVGLSFLLPRESVLEPISTRAYLLKLAGAVRWSEQCYVYRFELKSIYSERIVDRLVAIMRDTSASNAPSKKTS